MPAHFAPHLVEAVVRRHVDLNTRGIHSRYFEEHDRLIEEGTENDPAQRDLLNLTILKELELDRPFEEIIGEFSSLPSEVRISPPTKSEGCFLPQPPTVVLVRLNSGRLEDPERLRVWLRHECAHLADQIDPSFGYPQTLPDLDIPSRDRYSLLWGAYVDARTVRRNRTPLRSRSRWEAEVDRYWAHVDDEARKAAFAGFWSATDLTHQDLVDMGREPRRFIERFTDGAALGVPGGRCPLCDFATFKWVFPNGRLNSAVAAKIQGDFPKWDRERGACERCVELYEVKAGLW